MSRPAVAQVVEVWRNANAVNPSPSATCGACGGIGMPLVVEVAREPGSTLRICRGCVLGFALLMGAHDEGRIGVAIDLADHRVRDELWGRSCCHECRIGTRPPLVRSLSDAAGGER